MTYNVLIPDNVDKAAIRILEDSDALTVTAPGKMSRTEALAAVPYADALIIRSATTADAELLAAASKLKVIARAGVGVDNVDLPAATGHGVVVMNTPGGNTISTAEFTFGLMLALARHIPQGHASLTGGAWDRKSLQRPGTARQDAGHRRPGPHRARGRQTGHRLRHGGYRLRSLRQQ